MGNLLKVGQINLFQKKGDKQDPHNYRGVCHLAMGSRILAQIIAVRLRNWAEDLEPLDENQNGLRTGRSTADATQVFIRIEEDLQDLRKRRNYQGLKHKQMSDSEARLLDLTKAYPRVNKPALWEILRRYGIKGTFLDTIVDLHESTSFAIRRCEEDSEEWTPGRGLREGCSTSPTMFNIFHHQVVIRKQKALTTQKQVGIKWNWSAGSEPPRPQHAEKYNGESSYRHILSSLFADDTTILEETGEI